MTTDAQKCPILLLMSSNRQNRVLTKKFFRVQLAQKSPLPHVADVAGVAATSATPWRSWLPRPPRCGRGTATLTRRKRGKRGCHATATPLPHLDVTATRGSHAPSHVRFSSCSIQFIINYSGKKKKKKKKKKNRKKRGQKEKKRKEKAHKKIK